MEEPPKKQIKPLSDLNRGQTTVNIENHFLNGESSETKGLKLDADLTILLLRLYCCRTDCGCTYQINVCLLNENHEVLSQFRPDEVTLEPENNQSWIQVTNTFSDYGPGLRYISFEHGGVDTKYWKGFFGVRVTASSVTVNV